MCGFFFLVKPPYPPVKLFGGDMIVMIMIQIILNPNFVESKLLQFKFHETPFTSSKFH
jgi:hypothetical protein